MIQLVPYLMAGVCLAILLLNRNRIAIALLFAQYSFAFIISLPAQPLRPLIARLVGGLLVSIILYTSEVRFSGIRGDDQQAPLPSSVWFRMITAAILLLVVWTVGAQASSAIEAAVVLGSSVCIGFGLLLLGLYKSPLEAALGLLTLFIGFDLFYGRVEPSLSIVVLLISIQVIFALATSYLMSIRHYQSSADGTQS